MPLARILASLATLMIAQAALAAPPAAAASPSDECPQPRLVRVDIESWKKEISKKGATQARILELLEKLKLKTGFARELPDVDKTGKEPRTIEIRTVDSNGWKLTGGSRPETVVQVNYTLKVGKSCGEHEEHCFEGYGLQILKPLGKGLWCSLGSDLSAEVWGHDRDFTFCADAKYPAREYGPFSVTAPGRRVIQVDDFRAHCPSNGDRSRSRVRSFWEAQNGSLVEIFRATLHSEVGGPDHGKLTTLKGRLAFSGDFPKLVHYEVGEEVCGPEVFAPGSNRSSCQRSERFQVFQYRDGRYAPEAPPAH
jgi:hypothetical protein